MAMPKDEEWRERAGWLLAVALLGVIVFGYLMPATGYFTAVPGDIGDNRYNSATLEHLYRVTTAYDAGLWNPDFYFPFKGVLAFSENNLGGAASYVLARLFGLPREHAFNLWFAVGTLLNFASALYVIRRLGLSTGAAALGAFFFALALPVLAQDGHAQMVHRFAAPLATLALWQMFERRRIADIARLVFFTVWQFYCSIYLGLFLVYLLAALTVAILIVRKPFAWSQWRANLAAERPSAKIASCAVLVVSVATLAYLVGHYFLISRAYDLGGWSIEYISVMLPRMESYLIGDPSPLLGWLARDFMPARHEHHLFIGFGAVALISIAAITARHRPTADARLTRAMLIAVALLIAGTLWVGYLSLYYLIAWLPGIKAIRAVSRIILIMLVPMSVLVALGADAAWRRLRGLRALSVLAAALVVAEPLAADKRSVPIAEWQRRLHTLKELLPPATPKDAILLVRTGSPNMTDQTYAELDAMLLGQDLGYPVLNGYSAFFPPGYRLRACVPANERLEGYSQFMGGIDVSEYARRLVVVDLSTCPPAGR